ncbi:MAG: septal ring lytic transglycosylase RlpA family protein [Dokdonella sp.]
MNHTHTHTQLGVSAHLLVLLAMVLLAACAPQKTRPSAVGKAPVVAGKNAHETSLPQSQRYKQAQDGGPAIPEIDISSLREPEPKAEPRARYGNKSPYSVLGKTYTVMPDASGYVERGIASWYGHKFHGYMTSSFEPYDIYQFSAAHKSLPLPAYVRVTNLENGKSVVVRVNDRGPFHQDRLIDLSYAAAVRIGVWPKGTGMVEVRAIDLLTATEPKPVATVSPGSATGQIYLQLGAFGDRGNAERIAHTVGDANLGQVSIQTAQVDGRAVHRVRLGPLPGADAAARTSLRIEQLGLPTPRVAIED